MSAGDNVIFVRDYHETIRRIATEFFVFTIHYVGDIASWAKEKGVRLSEPAQPMKITAEGENLTLHIQEEISDAVLDDMTKGLNVRWSLIDNVSDPSRNLNSTEKRLVYCFLKEYATTLEDAAGDELIEDEWAIKEMKKLGFFEEADSGSDLK